MSSFRCFRLARSTNVRSFSKSFKFVRSNRLFAVGRWFKSKSREEKVKNRFFFSEFFFFENFRFFRLRRGLNILISTPGRLCDHIDNTQSLSLKTIQFLIFDEADKMLDMGFADAIKKIIETIRKNLSEDKDFQRVLLSATPTTGETKKRNAMKSSKNLVVVVAFFSALNTFVDINLNKNPLRVDISEEFNDESVITVPKTLQQLFTIVPSKLRFVTLIAFLLKIFNNKVKTIFVEFALKKSFFPRKKTPKFCYFWQRMISHVFITKFSTQF